MKRLTFALNNSNHFITTASYVMILCMSIVWNAAHSNEEDTAADEEATTTSLQLISIKWPPHHISSISLNYSLYEQLESGVFVADLRHDLKAIGKEIGNDSDFHLMDRNGKHVNYIYVDALSGRLRTSRLGRLDREQCNDNGANHRYHAIDTTMKLNDCLTEQSKRCHSCTLAFDVIVLPEMLIVKVIIEVLDVNDNVPKFSFGDVTTTGFCESSEIGAEIFVGSIMDADGTSAGNGFERCELRSPSADTANKIGIVIKRRLDDDVTVDLYFVLLDKLDRETDGSFFVVTLTAYDGGKPPRSASAMVNVTIIDVNDNIPQFPNTSYEVTVGEDIAVGTVLIHVEAIDVDSDSNGQITYSLSDECHRQHQGSDCAHQPFRVDPHSGAVMLIDALDFEERRHYLLSVVATDGGHDQLSDTVRVYINVVDVNDNAPSISVNPFVLNPNHLEYERTTGLIIQLTESVTPGSFVAHLSVSDPDDGLNGQLTCFIDVGSGRTHFTLSRLYDDEYVLVTAVGLDREQCDSYDVAVTCTDHGEDHLVSTRSIRVEIIDENDNSPVFAVNQLNITVVENNDIGCWLKDASASDVDVGLNAVIVYYLEPVDANHFVTINNETGALTAAVPFNQHELMVLNFYVVATDRGQPARCGRLPVTLYVVEDRSDDRVFFPTGHYLFHVYENQPPGVPFGVVSALAFDNGRIVTSSYRARSFHFSIKEDDGHWDVPKCCAMDRSTGRLMTTRTLDREQRSSFRLLVSASYRPPSRPTIASAAADNKYTSGNRCQMSTSSQNDSRRVTSSRSSSATVTIHVDDVNDNSPIFVFPGFENFTLTVTVNGSTKSANAESVVVDHHEVNYLLSTSPHLHAVDLDRGLNAVTTYSIVDGNGLGLFEVDSVTGQLMMNNDVELVPLKTTATYSLVAEAVDGGRPPLTSRVALIVVITANTSNVSSRSTCAFEYFHSTSGCGRTVIRSSARVDRVGQVLLLLAVGLVSNLSPVALSFFINL